MVLTILYLKLHSCLHLTENGQISGRNMLQDTF